MRKYEEVPQYQGQVAAAAAKVKLNGVTANGAAGSFLTCKELTIIDSEFTLNGNDTTGNLIWKPQESGAVLKSTGNTFIANGGVTLKTSIFVEPKNGTTGINVKSVGDETRVSSGNVQRHIRLNDTGDYGRVVIKDTEAEAINDVVLFSGDVNVDRCVVKDSVTKLTNDIIAVSSSLTGDVLMVTVNIGGAGGGDSSGTLTFTASNLTGNLFA